MNRYLERRLYNQQTPNYNPGVFEGATAEFKPIDFTPFERSLAKIEARMTTASEKQTAVDAALAEVETKLNPTEREWFSSYKKDIKDQIQGEIDAGNFGSAIRKANKLAGQVASDSKLLGRVEQNAKYQQAVKEVQGDKSLSKDTKDWWLANHQYSYEDQYDSNGNPIASDIKEYNDRPVAPVDLTKIAATAIQLVAPDKTSSKGSTTNYGGIGTNASNGQPLVSSGHDVSTVSLDESKLKETFDAIFSTNPEAKAYILQEREVAIWKLGELERLKDSTDDELQKRIYEDQEKQYKQELYGKDADGREHFMSETEYIANKISPILHNAAYEYKDTNYNSVYGTSGGGSNLGLGGLSGLPVGFIANDRPVKAGTVQLDYSSAGNTAVGSVGNAARSSKSLLDKKFNSD